MDVNNYKPNSHASKLQTPAPAEKKVEKVVSGPVKIKKNEIRKFTDTFIAEDIDTVKSYIFGDVIVPAVKKLIEDIVKDGITTLLWGESGRNRSRSSNGDRVSYRSYYNDPRDRDYRPSTSRNSSSRLFDYEDIVFASKGDAEAVLSKMAGLIKEYGYVTVADLYDMCERSAPYTANKYGWTNISYAESVRDRDGYVLKLPKAVQID